MKKVKILQKEDFGKICRCCLGMGPMTSIFELQFEETSFFEILQCLFCSEIKLDDELPKNICQQCIGEVVRCYSFKRSYDMAEAILLGVLEDNEEVEQKENDNTDEITLEIISEESCLKPNGAIEIQFYDSMTDFENVVENVCAGTNNSINVENCGDIEKTETTSVAPIDPFILDDLADQSENIPNNKTVSDTLPQQSQIISSPNFQTFPRNKVSFIKTTTSDGRVLKTITCSCLEVFETCSEYFLHRKKENKRHRPRYRCEVCNKCFSRSCFLTHVRSHTKEKPYKCELCPQSFTCGNNLQRHRKLHTGEKPHVCEQCGKAFAQKTTLVCHRRTHSKEKPCLCAICGKRFANSTLLYTHNRTHKKENSTPMKRTSRRHVQDQGVTSFLCSICGKQCPNRNSFNTHTLLRHKPNKRIYLCTYCGKSFTSSGVFQQHTFIHTGERRFSCTVCDKKFATSRTLQLHTYTHTGEKPYVCQICQRGFSQRQHLKSHLRTHSGEKPYKCKFCGKEFASKHNCIVHSRIHTGEKPFVCDGCQKGFYHSSALKKHRIRCKKEASY